MKLLQSHQLVLSKTLVTAFILSSLVACSRYSVSINENVVYQPPKVLTDFSIPDVALKNCVKSTIAEGALTRPEQLTRLLCPEGNIEDLDGLDTFSSIEVLGLDNNSIRDVTVLGALTKLKQLSIKNNQVTDFSPLAALRMIDLLDAAGNSEANCASFGIISARDGMKSLKLPEHC